MCNFGILLSLIAVIVVVVVQTNEQTQVISIITSMTDYDTTMSINCLSAPKIFKNPKYSCLMYINTYVIYFTVV